MGLAVETLCGSGPSSGIASGTASSGIASGAERSKETSSLRLTGGELSVTERDRDQAGNRMMRPSDATSRPGSSGTSSGFGRRGREGDGGGEGDGGYLTLKVVRPSQEEGEGIEIHFRVKQTTQVKVGGSY